MNGLQFSYRFEHHSIPITIYKNEGNVCAGVTPHDLLSALEFRPWHLQRILARTVAWIYDNLKERDDYHTLRTTRHENDLVLTSEGIQRIIPSLETYLSNRPNKSYLRALTLRGRLPELIGAIELAQAAVRIQPYQAAS